MTKVIVIGGGLAGLSSAIMLAQAGVAVTVIEKKQYPFHRVCGEYISNEVLPFLAGLGVNIDDLSPARISRFQLSSPSGKLLAAPLNLGGFGLSRYALDHYLYQLALQHGVSFKFQTAETVAFSDEKFTVRLADGSVLHSGIVIGAFGKRANLDRYLNRPFFTSRSPYLAVKYHLRTDLPQDVIALHNFENGYAGISAIEDNRHCFCYLTTRQNLKNAGGTVAQLEEKVLKRNPFLMQIFHESEFLYEKPEVINEISFAPKTAVTDHILCTGDAAGLITPLCGNGMAMALHASKILSTEILTYFNERRNRTLLETNYTRAWQNQFGARLRVGRTVQKLFGKKILSEITVGALQKMPAALQFIISNTHGKPF